MEKILAINEDGFKKGTGYYCGFDGFNIVTSEQTIKVGISNSSNCCENWGTVTSEDTFEDFIGAELLSVEVVNDKLEKTVLPELYEGSCMFVNFNTSKGLFQLVVYNDHNGYYSHEAVVISRELNHEEYL